MNTTPTDYKIEFMAWDGKQMHQNAVSITYKPEQMAGDLKLGHYYTPSFSMVHMEEVMQLTALRSINDEPIYNHMIVKDNFKNHFVVDMFDYWKMWGLAESKLEIVGNRFQSPELLELCK